MYRAVISLFILALLVGTVIAINPQAREEATDLWEETRPTLVGWKDKVLEVFQDVISSETDVHIVPEPISPDINIDIIIALRGDSSL